MRLIVPLQGIVQGRGGLILGSLLPCTLFYLLQLYLKRNRPSSPAPSPSLSSSNLLRSSSRSQLSNRGLIEPVRLSSRANMITKPNDSPYYIGLAKVSQDPYDKIINPNGVIQLGLSENRLSLDLIENWVVENLESTMIGGNEDELDINGVATYQQEELMELNEAMANFMSQIMGGTTPFDRSQLVLTSGATPALEILSFCLADQGNAFLIPTPYYPGFDRDIIWRTGVELISVHCHSSENFGLTISAMDQAFNKAMKRGIKVRGVLISNPSNPVGNLLSRETLHKLLVFSREKNIHIISDEIYAGSTYGNERFVSMAEILHYEDHQDKNRVHIVYGLSKDLSLAGLRIGVICSWNESILLAAKRSARFCSISTPTQKLIISLISDTKFIQNYIESNKERIRRMCEIMVSGLKRLGIKCVESNAGFYCWADMTSLMGSNDKEGELELWNKLLNIAKINVTPGAACHCIEPGWFRICFTTLDEEDISVVMERIRNIAETCKSSNNLGK